MPTRTRAAIRIFRELRTAHSVVVTLVDVGVGMADLDADEDHSGGDGGGSRPLG